MIERDVATIRNDAIDELDFARFERQGRVSLVELLLGGLVECGKLLFEDIIFVNCDNAKSPAGASKIL